LWEGDNGLELQVVLDSEGVERRLQQHYLAGLFERFLVKPVESLQDEM